MIHMLHRALRTHMHKASGSSIAFDAIVHCSDTLLLFVLPSLALSGKS